MDDVGDTGVEATFLMALGHGPLLPLPNAMLQLLDVLGPAEVLVARLVGRCVGLATHPNKALAFEILPDVRTVVVFVAVDARTGLSIRGHVNGTL